MIGSFENTSFLYQKFDFAFASECKALSKNGKNSNNGELSIFWRLFGGAELKDNRMREWKRNVTHIWSIEMNLSDIDAIMCSFYTHHTDFLNLKLISIEYSSGIICIHFAKFRHKSPPICHNLLNSLIDLGRFIISWKIVTSAYSIRNVLNWISPVLAKCVAFYYFFYRHLSDCQQIIDVSSIRASFEKQKWWVLSSQLLTYTMKWITVTQW